MRKIRRAFLLGSLLFSLGHTAWAQDAVLAPSVPEVVEGAPLGVRFPSLPNPEVQAVPGDSVSHKHAKSPATTLLRSTSSSESARSKAEGCKNPDDHEAFDAYRQAAIDEVESDRLTLKAIQEALGELNLTDRLDFMLNPAGQLATVPKTDEKENQEKTKP